MAGFLGNFQGTYDPSKVIITIDGVSLHGFADGDFLTAKLDEDRYAKLKGIDGEISRVLNNSTSGTLEFTLSSASAVNYELNGFNPEFGYLKTYPITIADLSGKTVCGAENAWLKKTPDLTFGKEIGEYKWVFDCAQMTIVYDGQNNNSLFDAVRSLF